MRQICLIYATKIENAQGINHPTLSNKSLPDEYS